MCFYLVYFAYIVSSKRNKLIHMDYTRMIWLVEIVWNLIAQTGINLEVSEAVFKKSLIRLINTDGL